MRHDVPRWWRVLRTLALGLALAFLLDVPSPAAAHGKDLDIKVSRLTPDPDRPLIRLYTAQVRYAGDGEPLLDAKVTMSATRREGDETIPSILFSGVQSTPGLYAAEVPYRRFGTFDLVLRVAGPLGEGEGEIRFSDQVRPASLTDAQRAAMEVEALRVLSLQAQFGFGWWPDVVNIVGRIVHSLAGITYFAVTGLVTVAAWSAVGIPGSGWIHRLWRRYYLPLAMGSLVVLLAAGLYSAWFDAPVRPPGIFDLDAMRRLPYGNWYLAAFIVKPALFSVLVLLALRMRGQLDAWTRAIEGDRPADAQTATSALRRSTFLNAAAGVAVFADIAIVIYLHYVSHLGVFLPG